MADIGTTLIKLRAIKGFSQEAVAEEIGVSDKTYGRYEADTTEMKISTLQALADFYEMTIDELIAYDPDNPVEKKRRSYDDQIKEQDHKLMVLEQREQYLSREAEMLRKLTETQQKYVQLLEEKLNNEKLGGASSAPFNRRAV